MVIPLINWSGERLANSQVEVRIEVPNAKAILARGAPVEVKSSNTGLTTTFAIDEADALIFRNQLEGIGAVVSHPWSGQLLLWSANGQVFTSNLVPGGTACCSLFRG